MEFSALITGAGCPAEIHVLIDGYDENGREIGVCETGTHDGEYKAAVENVTGRHSVFLKVNHPYREWFSHVFDDRNLFDLISIVFKK